MKRMKILLVLIIIVGVLSLLFGGYFISKNMNNEIKNQEQLKSEEINNIDNNNLSNENESINEDEELLDNNNSSKNMIQKEVEEGNNIIDNDTSSKNIPKEETINIPSKFELKSIGNLQYYLYTPSNPTNNMSLIMYLHGGTNKVQEVESLLTTDGFSKYLYDGYYGDLRAYVVIPKLDNNYTGWVDIYEILRDLIKSMNTNYGIDLNKVSLTGHSMGATGTYQVQVKLSNTFACIAPMSGSIKNNEENLNALSKTKIWAFVGANDTIVDPTSTKTIIDALKKMGAYAKITEFDETDHFGVPSLGYKNIEFINWLVNCSK